MSRSLNIALILTAYDKATRVINDAVGKSNQKLRELKKNSQDAFGKGLAYGSAGLAIAIDAQVKAAGNDAGINKSIA